VFGVKGVFGLLEGWGWCGGVVEGMNLLSGVLYMSTVWRCSVPDTSQRFKLFWPIPIAEIHEYYDPIIRIKAQDMNDEFAPLSS